MSIEKLSLTAIVGATSYVNCTEQELQAKGIEQPLIDAAKAEAKQAEINAIASDYITNQYPEWKQLNVLRSGTADEKEAMSNFIDSVRDWSNSDDPQLDELHEIQA